LAKAGKSVILCATQRTGSTLIYEDVFFALGQKARHSEILYDRIIRRRDMRSWEEIWSEVSAINQVAGYFIDKVMFHYVGVIARFIEHGSAADLQSVQQFEPAAFDHFQQFFADAIWVYVERRDVFAQAVSMCLAETTQIWEQRVSRPPKAAATGADLGYQYTRFKRYLDHFLHERRQWQLFFHHYRIDPVRIYYEDAIADHPEYLRELINRAGLQIVESPLPRRLIKLGNELNDQLATYLRNDLIIDLYARGVPATASPTARSADGPR
jgi:trehalose 2-sulfotransferase